MKCSRIRDQKHDQVHTHVHITHALTIWSISWIKRKLAHNVQQQLRKLPSCEQQLSASFLLLLVLLHEDRSVYCAAQPYLSGTIVWNDEHVYTTLLLRTCSGSWKQSTYRGEERNSNLCHFGFMSGVIVGITILFSRMAKKDLDAVWAWRVVRGMRWHSGFSLLRLLLSPVVLCGQIHQGGANSSNL